MEKEKIYELAKMGVDYDRQLAIVGKEKADTVLYFWMEGYKYAEQHIKPIEPIRNLFCFTEDDLRTAINLARKFNRSDMGVIEYINSEGKIIDLLKKNL